jgi:hypothetical protein
VATEIKYRLSAYDGGLEAHPVPERAGQLWLVGSWWELHFKHADQFVNGELTDYVFEALPIDKKSCLVSIREVENDGEILCTFALPDTSADCFISDLDQRLAELRVPHEQGAETEPRDALDSAHTPDDLWPGSFVGWDTTVIDGLRVVLDRRPFKAFDVLAASGRVGSISLGGREELARMASAAGVWCLKKSRRVGWEFVIESSDERQVASYSGRHWLTGGTIWLGDGTRVDLRRALNRRWKLRASDTGQPFADIRTSAPWSKASITLTMRALPAGIADAHLVMLIACTVLMLDLTLATGTSGG